MQERLMQRLCAVTAEEQRLLNGGVLHPEDYTARPDFRVDSGHLLPSGQWIALRPHTRFAAFPRHTHNYIEIMYQVTGQTCHLIDDRERVILRAGELLLMNQHAAHAIDPAEKEDVAVNMIVMPAFFEEVLPQLDDGSMVSRFLVSGLTQRDEGVGSLLFHVSDVPAIQSLMESMIADLLDDTPMPGRIAGTAMALLFLHLTRHTDALDAGSSDHPHEHALVLAALREVQEHYRAPSLTAVAARYGASITYVSRMVRRATGRTFTELLQDKRMERARELLLHTDLTVQELLPLIGYSNSSYFYRLFEKTQHMSPRQYRLAHLSAAGSQSGTEKN